MTGMSIALIQCVIRLEKPPVRLAIRVGKQPRIAVI